MSRPSQIVDLGCASLLRLGPWSLEDPVDKPLAWEGISCYYPGEWITDEFPTINSTGVPVHDLLSALCRVYRSDYDRTLARLPDSVETH
jgi:hypothetical protein